MEPYKKNIIAKSIVLLLALFFVVIGNYYARPILIKKGATFLHDYDSSELLARASKSKTRSLTQQITTVPIVVKDVSFLDIFDKSYSVEEAGSINSSSNQNWWVSSGAYFNSTNGEGKTLQGSLSSLNPWRVAYKLSNSIDTGDGYYPQNIFRLISKSQIQNFQIESYFKIVKDNLTNSPNRNQSNGLLFMTRYTDANNLYYIGIRVDGTAIIKKKKNGIYYTLYQEKIPGISGTYDSANNPDLLPHSVWIGLRAQIVNDTKGGTIIKEFMDLGKTGTWTQIADFTDDGVTNGGSALLNSGYTGIRTDFMDVVFDDYKVSSL